jgi:hypothetical protein
VGLERLTSSTAPTRAFDEVICHLYTACIFGGLLAAHRNTPDLHAARAFALKEGPKMARAAIATLRKRQK